MSIVMKHVIGTTGTKRTRVAQAAIKLAVCVVRAGKGSKEEVKRPNASNAPMQ